MRPETRAKLLAQTEARRKLEREDRDAAVPASGQQAKPRLSIDELARRRARCVERKRVGLPCREGVE